MKKKRFALFLCTLYLLCLMFALPAAAKSKPAPKKITLSREKIVLYKGESKKLIVEKTKPAYASPKVTWTSKNKKVADVSKYGKITAKKPGRTTITAVSKKNPSVRATVRVTVKKSPEKTEKECPVTGHGLASREFCKLVNFYCHTYLRGSTYMNPLNGVIIRSRDGFNEMKNFWNKNSRDLPFRKTFLAEYGNIDFSKESLILLEICISSFPECDYQVTSLATKFDSAGKLEGIIDIHDNTPYVPSDPHAKTPQIFYPCTLAFSVKKGDEAMIDHFRIGKLSTIYDNFMFFP